jgi:hypothetical protein
VGVDRPVPGGGDHAQIRGALAQSRLVRKVVEHRSTTRLLDSLLVSLILALLSFAMLKHRRPARRERYKHVQPEAQRIAAAAMDNAFDVLTSAN